MRRASDRACIICLEGPSAAGKTSMAADLARRTDAVVIPEPDSSGTPAIPDSAEWFVDLATRTWSEAVRAAASAALVVLDGDPFKGLWYNWIFAAEGWPGIDGTLPLYRSRAEAGRLALPHLYVLLRATESQLRQRRQRDATRARRNFEKHIRLLRPQQQYFTAVSATGLVAVLQVDTSDRDVAVDRVLSRVRGDLSEPGSATAFVERMADWIASNPGPWNGSDA